MTACAERVPVSEGDDVDVDAEGKSALHIAAIHDSVEIAKMLIEKGCPLLIQDLEVSTSLNMYTIFFFFDYIDQYNNLANIIGRGIQRYM